VTLINKESSENELLENDCPIEQPILLLSPLENWVLASDKLLESNPHYIESAISSCLTVPSSF